MNDLTNLVEWNRWLREGKTMFEVLTILNNRHREEVGRLKGLARKLTHWLECIWNDTEGFADGAPDADDHDKMCLHVSSIAKAGLDNAKEADL